MAYVSQMRNQSCMYHISVNFESHVCERFSRKRICCDKLCNDIETELKVGDCLDDSDRNEKHECDYNCQSQSPPGLTSVSF